MLASASKFMHTDGFVDIHVLKCLCYAVSCIHVRIEVCLQTSKLMSCNHVYKYISV